MKKYKILIDDTRESKKTFCSDYGLSLKQAKEQKYNLTFWLIDCQTSRIVEIK